MRAALFAAAAVGVSISLGYYSGKAARVPTSVSHEQPQVLADSANSVRPTLTAPKPTFVEMAIDATARTEKENDLYRALGDDPVGAKVRRALIAQNHREVPGVDAFVQNFVEELVQDSSAAKDTVRTALARISADNHPLERVALLAALASDPRNADAVRALALNEFTENPPEPRPDPKAVNTSAELDAALSTTPAQTRPIAAQGLFLKTARDANEALAGTLTGITSQQDWGIRAALAQQFLGSYPSMKSALVASLNKQGISLELGQEE